MPEHKRDATFELVEFLRRCHLMDTVGAACALDRLKPWFHDNDVPIDIPNVDLAIEEYQKWRI